MSNRQIFVFGSNEAGRHGAGAALCALREHGALLWHGVGLHGNSYAIPTKDQHLDTLPIQTIDAYVSDFKRFARLHPELTFNVTRIGCGLAGFTDFDIAPLFANAPDNCILPSWRNWK